MKTPKRLWRLVIESIVAAQAALREMVLPHSMDPPPRGKRRRKPACERGKERNKRKNAFWIKPTPKRRPTEKKGGVCVDGAAVV